MKNTMKMILVIALFLSTATITFADGDQQSGTRCQTCGDSIPGDSPELGEAIVITNNNLQNSSQTNEENEENPSINYFFVVKDLILYIF